MRASRTAEQSKNDAVGVSVLHLLHDFEQLDLEDERGAGLDLGR